MSGIGEWPGAVLTCCVVPAGIADRQIGSAVGALDRFPRDYLGKRRATRAMVNLVCVTRGFSNTQPGEEIGLLTTVRTRTGLDPEKILDVCDLTAIQAGCLVQPTDLSSNFVPDILPSGLERGEICAPARENRQNREDWIARCQA